jgi:hypothetical protein
MRLVIHPDVNLSMSDKSSPSLIFWYDIYHTIIALTLKNIVSQTECISYWTIWSAEYDIDRIW